MNIYMGEYIPPRKDSPMGRPRSWVFNIPFTPATLDEAAEEMERLIFRGNPSYVITANLNYAMRASGHPDLDTINRRAAMVVADGMPLVWISRMTSRPLPERITGTNLLLSVQ